MRRIYGILASSFGRIGRTASKLFATIQRSRIGRPVFVAFLIILMTKLMSVLGCPANPPAVNIDEDQPFPIHVQRIKLANEQRNFVDIDELKVNELIKKRKSGKNQGARS